VIQGGRPVFRPDALSLIHNGGVGIVVGGAADADAPGHHAVTGHDHVHAIDKAVPRALVERHGLRIAANQDGGDRQVELADLPDGIKGGIAERLVDELLLVGDGDRALVRISLGQSAIEEKTGARINHTDDEVDLRLPPIAGEGDGRNLSGDHSLHAQSLAQALDAGEVERRGQVVGLDAVEQVLSGQDSIAVELRQLDHKRIGGKPPDIIAAIPRGISEVQNGPGRLRAGQPLCPRGRRAEQEQSENGQRHQYREQETEGLCAPMLLQMFHGMEFLLRNRRKVSPIGWC